jgi:hypothetical protein
MMKTLLGIVLMAIAFVSISPCDLRIPVELDLANSGYLNDFDYVLLFRYDSASADTLQALLYDYTGSFTSLELNGGAVDYSSHQEDPPVYLFDDLDMSPGDTLSYKLSSGKASWQGNIIIPERPSLMLPEFDRNANYTFSWTSVSDPLKFVVSYLIYDNDHYEQGNDTNVVTADREIPGTLRSYTILRSRWSSMITEAMDHAEAKITAFNFKTHGSNLVVLAQTWDEMTAQ